MAAVGEAIHVDVRRKTFPAVGRRDAIEVLRDIDIEVARGSFVVITGPSGCGKSTLLNVIAGLDADFEGRVALGANVSRLTYVFQTPRLLPWRTIEENIRLSLPGDDPRQAEVPRLLARVGLAEAADAYPERVSLGMQRRAALARAFIQEPDVLLMDEPFVSLDDPTAESLRQLLLDLYASRPTTVLFVTHDRFEAVTLATRILRLSGGSATIIDDKTVTLSRAERADRERVSAEQKRIFGSQ